MHYIGAAAAGSLEAQRALASEACRLTVSGETDPYITMVEGLVFARMAAAHGDSGDVGRVLAMLAICSDLCAQAGQSERAMAHDAEALATAAAAADLGLPIEEELLDLAVAGSAPETVQAAQELRRVIAGGKNK